LAFIGKNQGQNIIDILLKGTNVPVSISNFYRINTTTTVTNTLVPEIRGASNFSAAASNMLIVIDGFPQDGFPANYPMTNVESIEVIKDQKELVKWGPKAQGGAILIRSKSAKAGKLQINYTANFYFTPAPKFDRSQLKLADSRTYLSYLRAVDSLLGNSYGATQFNLSPAKQLLRLKGAGSITKAQFNSQWDSLSRNDNQSQLSLLQQNAFSQNHTLTVSGGNRAYKFTAVGGYLGDKTNDLGSHTDTYSFGLDNIFNLFKDKLHMSWRINYSDARSKSGNTPSPTSAGLEPYQMLLDDQGNYAYDYTSLSASANQTLLSKGYKNYGVNILQDSRINSFTNSVANTKSNFLMNWNLLPGLSWSSSVFYTGKSTNNRNLYDAESSYARQLVDQYGQYSTKGINFYVPYGDILQANNSTYNEWNVRSGLFYTKAFNKHVITVGVGGGLASTSTNQPAYNTQYGYNPVTNTSTPIYLPTSPSTISSISNFYSLFSGTGATVYPYSLTVPTGAVTASSRNLNGNLSLDYRFSDRINASGIYTDVLSPLYGQANAYSTSSTYKGDVTGRVVKKWGTVVRDILVSVGGEGLQMPNLPAIYSNIRYQQTLWTNYAIWVNGATPTQQQGQSSNKLYEKLTVSFLDSSIVLNGAYNTQRIQGNLISLTGSDAADQTVTTSKFFTAGADLFLRRKLLTLHVDYSKSPEGLDQYNGTFKYIISREPFFKSNKISDLEFDATLQNISPYQGLSIMQSTNVATNGSFSQATNNSFTLLPPNNKSFEAHGKISFYDSKYSVDLRYYNQTSSGLNNNLSTLTDPTTGLSNQTTYSTLTNKGVEFYFNIAVIKKKNFSYNIVLNGAHNQNVATNVPVTAFTGSSSYETAVRNGYDVSNIWAPKWAGLSATGEPQIYDKNGKIAAKLDSATIADAIVKQGVTKAPWTGGLIQEARIGQFFTRVAVTFNLGYVMRYYLPYPGYDGETSSLVADRWQKPGDEAFTDIPKIGASTSDGFRNFVTRYSSNSILPADNIRLQEVMIGYNIPARYLAKYKLSSFVMTLQVTNLAYWARNKYGIDPATVSTDGRIGMPTSRTYSCNISMNF